MKQADLKIMQQATDLPVPESDFIDIFCDTWTPPEVLELTPLHYGYEGRLMDAGRIRKSFQKAIGAVFPGNGKQKHD